MKTQIVFGTVADVAIRPVCDQPWDKSPRQMQGCRATSRPRYRSMSFLVTLWSPGRDRLRSATFLACVFFACFALFLGGCATAPSSHKVSSGAAAKLEALPHVTLASLDIEVSELSAGGVREVRDEWTSQVRSNLIAALTAPGRIKVSRDLNPAEQAELDDAAALLRVLAISRFAGFIDPPQLQRAWQTQPLDFNLGRIDRLCDAASSEMVLLVFVRDSYATAGRKSLAVLGVLAGAVTGVMIVPQMGTTQLCAALVERDGDVLWFSALAAGTGDLREASGAAAAAKNLMTGWPSP